MTETEIPSYFLCPISFQIMRDPVTLMTGITYDRGSIEQWLFSGERRSCCPVTNQRLSDCNLTPNHTLRRLIQAWCVANGAEPLPTPRPPVDSEYIGKIINRARSPQFHAACLKKLKCLVLESESNRRCIEMSSGAVDFLAAVVESRSDQWLVDDALSILKSLKISEQGLIYLAARAGDFVAALTAVLQRSDSKLSRANAMILLKGVLSVIEPDRLVCIREEVYVETVRVLRDKISSQATRAALETLAGLCPWGRNRIKAVKAGAVHVLVELLIDELERRGCEMLLAVLDKLSGCAEGRAEIVGHAAGIAAVSKKIFRVSSTANDRAVRILYSVCSCSATKAVLQEMVQSGVVTKLCMLMLGDCSQKSKARVKEILRMHSRVWRVSPCLSPPLRDLYPC